MSVVIEKVGGCHDCPFFTDDSDNGTSCYHGIKLNTNKREDYITIKIGCVVTTLPKKCPLLTNTFTIKMDDVLKNAINEKILTITK